MHPVGSIARISRGGECLIAPPPDQEAPGGLRLGCRDSRGLQGPPRGLHPLLLNGLIDLKGGGLFLYPFPSQFGEVWAGRSGELEAPLKLRGTLVTLLALKCDL